MWGDGTSRASRRRARVRQKAAVDGETSSTTDLSLASQNIGDRMIEVVGLENCLHMGQVRTGLRASGKRLAQCSSVTIRTSKQFPMQIDGEPWNQPPCTMEISHKNQVPMLLAPPPKSRSLFSFLSLGLTRSASKDFLEDQ